MSKQLHSWEQELIDQQKNRIAELEAENLMLREALGDAIDGYEECAAYKGEYLYNKHGDKNEIARLRAALEGEQDGV